MEKKEKIEMLSGWYFNDQLNFDRVLITCRYRTINKFFRKGIGLEMGPGDGVMTRYLITDFEQLDVVDGSEQLLNSIPAYPNIRKHCAFFEEFVPDRSFDTIIMEHILEHLEDPVKVLKRAASWLKPDGVLIAGVPNAKSFHRLAAVKMGLLVTEYELNDRDRALGHYRIYDTESLGADIVASGLHPSIQGGVFFKPVSNKQIEDTWTPEMIEGFYLLGATFPQNAAEIFVVATF
ncbi:MAG: class I SAM-dependent methyltransferase [Bacteroidetes bacterium]|nr:class I SAM-dependent methyltransferase [Bacteroidota bacterium]